MESEMDQVENGSKSEHMRNVPANLLNYGTGQILDGQVTIQTSAATYIDKGEDRHVVSFGNKEMAECQEEFHPNVPRMVAYIAVFDGHDGPNASEYAYKGLLPHILSETEESIRKNKGNKQVVAVNGDKVDSSLDAGIINGFHKAQDRFAKQLDPPTFQDVKKGIKATRFGSKGHLARLLRKPRGKPRGGTTALTLQIYGEIDPDSKSKDSLRPTPYVVVANAGDCRLLTDDGLGSHEFRQVTIDHRPTNDDEHTRLKECVRQGDAFLGREMGVGTLRVYPGGLAVSRSIGDLNASGAIMCTPDVHRLPVADDGRVHRLVLGSDGLWDVLENSEVEKIVARVQKKKIENATNEKDKCDNANAANEETTAKDEEQMIVEPNQAASKLMEECLKKGGTMDDVTLIIVDISYAGSKLK